MHHFVEYLYRIFVLNICGEYLYGIFCKGIKKINLNGLTVVKRNLSANPLSIHTVLPIDVNALKNGWGWTPRHIEVELIGTYLCHSWAKDVLSPRPSNNWFINPMLDVGRTLMLHLLQQYHNLQLQLACPQFLYEIKLIFICVYW